MLIPDENSSRNMADAFSSMNIARLAGAPMEDVLNFQRRIYLSNKGQAQLDSQMPLRRYFMFVGGALLLLLFVANILLPMRGSNQLTSSRVRLPTVRIHTQLRGPDAVVIDTGKSRIDPIPPQEDLVQRAATESDSGESTAVEQPEALSLAQVAGNEKASQQDSRKPKAAGLERWASMHGPAINNEPRPASLHSGLEFRDTFAQLVLHSPRQPGRRVGNLARSSMFSGGAR